MEGIQHRHGYPEKVVVLPVYDVRRHTIVERIVLAVPLAVERELVPAAEGKGGADFLNIVRQGQRGRAAVGLSSHRHEKGPRLRYGVFQERQRLRCRQGGKFRIRDIHALYEALVVLVGR